MMCTTLLCAVCDVVVSFVLDVQVTKLERLEHNPLVIISSHSHHLQHWILVVSVMCDVYHIVVCRVYVSVM